MVFFIAGSILLIFSSASLNFFIHFLIIPPLFTYLPPPTSFTLRYPSKPPTLSILSPPYPLLSSTLVPCSSIPPTFSIPLSAYPLSLQTSLLATSFFLHPPLLLPLTIFIALSLSLGSPSFLYSRPSSFYPYSCSVSLFHMFISLAFSLFFNISFQ